MGLPRLTPPPPGYFIFNDFPPSIPMEGLFVKDDLEQGHALAEDAFHFTPGELAGWTREGEAFADAPPIAPFPAGHRSRARLAPSSTASRTAGDAARGRLLSPAFTLRGDRMRLRVGGGRDPLHLRVSLLVDGSSGSRRRGRTTKPWGGANGTSPPCAARPPASRSSMTRPAPGAISWSTKSNSGSALHRCRASSDGRPDQRDDQRDLGPSARNGAALTAPGPKRGQRQSAM